MSVSRLYSRIALALTIASTLGSAAIGYSESHDHPEPGNKQLVQASFDRWHEGAGGPFELLADDAHWTIVGSSPVSKTYKSKEQFMTEVIRPFNARMKQPLKPTIRSIHADGDAVIVLFDGESECLDGRPYRNTYAWFMRMKNGRAIDVTAFFDTRLFDEMWARVTPQ